MFVFWFTLQEEQERRSGIKEPSHSDSDSSSGSKKYVKTTVAQLLRIEDFFKRSGGHHPCCHSDGHDACVIAVDDDADDVDGNCG